MVIGNLIVDTSEGCYDSRLLYAGSRYATKPWIGNTRLEELQCVENVICATKVQHQAVK
jgi:hypothetical protein